MSPDRELRPRPVLGELSAEAKAARAPLRPEELVGALNGCVHRDPGRARPARTARHANRESLGRVGLVVLALAACVALTSCVDQSARVRSKSDAVRACIAGCRHFGCGAKVNPRLIGFEDGCVCMCTEVEQ